jgi:hypothetical protein
MGGKALIVHTVLLSIGCYSYDISVLYLEEDGCANEGEIIHLISKLPRQVEEEVLATASGWRALR